MAAVTISYGIPGRFCSWCQADTCADSSRCAAAVYEHMRRLDREALS